MFKAVADGIFPEDPVCAAVGSDAGVAAAVGVDVGVVGSEVLKNVAWS